MWLVAYATRGFGSVAAFGLGLAHDSASVDALASVVRAATDSGIARAAAWSLGEIGAPAIARRSSEGFALYLKVINHKFKDSEEFVS